MSYSTAFRSSQRRADSPRVARLAAAVAAGLLVHASARAQAPSDEDTETLAAVSDESQTFAAVSADAGPLDEILVVRARNRVENQQDVPISISVVRGEELETLQANEMNALTMRAANVSWNQGNQRTSSLSIRGIGKQGQTEAQDPSVGVIVDGVNYAYNALTSSFDFTDVDVVEVVRGPQGTLLGKNTSLGVINVTTRRPSFTPDVDYSVTIGERDTVIGRAAGGGPIIEDKLAWRGSLTMNKGEGYLTNTYNPDITYQNKERISGRVQFLYAPNQTFSARVALDATPRSGETTNGRALNLPTPTVYPNGLPNTSLTNEMRLVRPWFSQQESFGLDEYLYGGGGLYVTNDSARPLVTGSNGATVELNWDDIGPFSFTSITAYKDYHFNAVNDEGTPFDVYRNSGGFWNDYEQFSQELRVSSDTGGLVDYQAGLYFMNVDNSADYRRVWGNDAGAWFASNGQYSRLDVATNGDGSASGGRYLLRNSLAGLSMSFNSPAGVQDIENKSSAIFAQANWHLGEKFTLTTGVRLTQEDRTNITSSGIKDSGSAPELNPFIVNGVDLGGFDSAATNGVLAATNTAAQLSLADLVASKYFGIPVTSLPGQAYGALTVAQRQQVADAKAIRRTAIGVVFDDVEAQPFEDTQPAFVLSPTYRFGDRATAYVSWQYGEKAGISQTTNGISNLVLGEETSAFEIGIKTTLLEGNLVFNADLFSTDIDNYQQGVRVLDEYTTALNIATGISPSIAYTTSTGNVPKVHAEGLEIDGVYAGIPRTRLRFALAYNDAVYDEFPNSAQPSENGYNGAPPYRDVSGMTLPGSSKLSGNIGIDYRQAFAGDKEFHVSANVAYASKTNTDNALSDFGWIGSRSVTDIAVGFGRAGGTFDVSLLAKNVFDDETPLGATWNSYIPPEPRWLGVVISGRL
jgi:iron complex outermembrane recepter protein